MKTMSGKASSIGRGWLAGRDPLLSQHYLSRVQEVQAEDIWRVARTYLLEETENLVELVSSSAVAQAGSAVSVPQAAREVELFRIAGSLRGLHYMSDRLPLVSLRAVLAGGLLAEPPQLAGINYLATQMLIKGTKKRSATQLAVDVEQLGGHISVDAGNNSSTLGLELLASDWNAGAQILLEVLTQPAFSPAELATEKRKQLSALRMEKDHPMALARNLMRSALFAGHPYAHPPLGREETIEAISIDDIRRHAESQLLTRDAIIALAGPVPPKHWEKEIASLCGPLADKPRLIPALDPPQPLTQPKRAEERCPKEQAVLQIGFATPPLTHADHIALAVLDEALSDLGSRLFIKIREELGLAYFVGTSQFLAMASGYFVFYCGTDPAKRQQVEERLMEEIRIIAESGVTSAEVERARAKILSQHKIELQSPGAVLQHAALDELYGVGYDFEAKRMARFAEISLEEINQTAKNYFSTPNHVTVVVSPE
jgi:zinc protease